MVGELKIGMCYESEMCVEPEHTALKQGSGQLEVFATPCLVALMENSAMQAVQKALVEGSGTVGTKIAIEHIAATPVGMHIRAKAVLEKIDGRKLIFSLEAFDEKEKIGFGTHERFVIDNERFMSKAIKKKEDITAV